MTSQPPGDLDASSSQALHPAAREALLAALDAGYADPRRLHRAGRTARLLLDNARAATAEALGCRPDEVTFTPSGTHAVHLGLLGLHVGSRAGTTIVHSAVEHSAVLHAATWAERWASASVRPVAVDRVGRVDPGALDLDGASVVAVQSANHEVGTLQPVDDLELDGVPLFVDAGASAGRLPLPQRYDALAASAHKWGGPAGVGVLVVRKGARWRPVFPGDDRVDERSTGFENVPAALAAAAALQAVVADRAVENARQHALVDRIRAAASALPDVDVLGDPERRLPHLVTFSCLYVDGEALVTELDRLGFGVDSGSSCTASTLEPSHVLAAMGALTHGNVRVSVGPGTTDDQVSAFVAALPGVVERTRATL